MADYVQLDDGHYFVDIVRVPGEQVHLKCIMFDMKSLWIEQLSIEAVVARENKRDPVCCYTEALIDTLLAKKPASYTLHSSATGDEDACEDHRTLAVKYYVYETPVTLEFRLKPGSVDEMSECVILPLWRAVLLLDAKNRSLTEQLVQKDVEIAQYRAEGAELKRTTVQTTKFEAQQFNEKFPLSAPTGKGLNISRILDGREQRQKLINAVQLVVESTGQLESPSTSGRGIKRSPSSRWATSKRPVKKWKHQRVDILCTKIKFPNLPDNPLNKSMAMAKRFKMQESDDEAKNIRTMSSDDEVTTKETHE